MFLQEMSIMMVSKDPDLILLGGDIERNPGPITGNKARAINHFKEEQ